MHRQNTALLGIVLFASLLGLSACHAPESNAQTSVSTPDGTRTTRISLMNGTSQPVDLGIEGMSPTLTCERGIVTLRLGFKNSDRLPTESKIKIGETDTTHGTEGYVRLTNESEDEDTCVVKQEKLSD